MSVYSETAGGGASTGRLGLPWIITASSVGTLIEWYDFYLYGVLALFFSRHFFSPELNPTVAFIASLFVFWTGFLVRPFGAILFGHSGDLIGRKFTFMLTLGFALAVVTFWPVFTWLGTFKDNSVMLTILVFYLVILVTMVYGPIAAFLVELFPARIRYTSMSLPYHVGNGVFGGLVPAAGASIAAITGIALSGLLYPMAIAAIGGGVSLAFIREPTHRIRIWDEVGGGAPPLVPDQP